MLQSSRQDDPEIRTHGLRPGEEGGRGERPLMVRVRDAYKTYNMRSHVLKGFNMFVEEGTIYAYLGPSGCGKTTLLGCLVGRKKLDSGQIQLGVRYKHEVGYMPQEPGLIKEMTIKETLYYYGKLFKLTDNEAAERKKELFDFLEMPPETRSINNLSGGQQRRVSLCITLFHSPKLLILDEPTVGVDPLLCHRIWQYLIESTTKHNKTVIITTHYIEEARQAHTVGMMRGGVLLVEDSPRAVLARYNCERLEDVFLRLSQAQEDTIKHQPKEKIKFTFKSLAHSGVKSPIMNEKKFSFSHVWAHILKNIFWLRRNQVILCFVLTLPIVQTTLFGWTIGRDPTGIKLGYVNEEVGFHQDCGEAAINCTGNYFASCGFLRHLNKRNLVLIEFENTGSARWATEKGDIWGFFLIKPRYTDALFSRIENNFNTQDEELELSEVDAWLDMSSQYIGNFIKRDMYLSYLDFLIEIYSACNWPIKAAGPPINMEKAIYGDNYPRFSDFAVPAVLQLFTFYLPMLLTVGSLLMEKREGLLERNLISGLTLFESLVGHTILAMSVLSLQVVSMLVLIYVIFEKVMVGNVLLSFALCMVVGFCGMCYGFLVSIICDSDMTATYMGLGSFFPLAMLSGMFWPFEGMHSLLRIVGWVLPLTLTTDAFRSISARGFGLSHPTVWIAFLITTTWIFIFIFSTYAMSRLKTIFKRITG